MTCPYCTVSNRTGIQRKAVQLQRPRSLLQQVQSFLRGCAVLPLRALTLEWDRPKFKSHLGFLAAVWPWFPILPSYKQHSHEQLACILDFSLPLNASKRIP